MRCGLEGQGLEVLVEGMLSIEMEESGEEAGSPCFLGPASTSVDCFDTPPLDSPSPAYIFSNKTKRKPQPLDQSWVAGKKQALGQREPAWEEEGRASPSPSAQAWLSTYQSWSPGEKVAALSALVHSCALSEIRHLRDTIEPHFQKDFIAALPKELALIVLSQLSAKDLARAAAVSLYWRSLTEDYLLWKEKCGEAGLSFEDYPGREADDRSSCFQRSSWKALYLRHCKVNSNWRRGVERGDGSRKLLRGHEDHVITCLQIAGDKILSGSDDNTLRVWSAARGHCVRQLSGHTGGVWSSQITPDGKIVLSGSTDRTVRVWDTDTGECLHVLRGHTSTVRCMALKGSELVSGSRDTTLRVWDIYTGRTLHVLNGHVAAVRCVQFDGTRVVSGAYDYTVKVWDAATERCTHTLAGHTNRVYSLQLDAERNIVISGSLDTSIRVWDLSTGTCVHTLMGHQSLTSGMELRGRILVSGNADSTVKVWDVVDGQCLHTLSGANRHTSAVTSLQFLSNGLVVTSSDDGTVKLWDAVSGTFVRDVVELASRDSGGCIWRLKATPTALVCAVGSRTGTEDTKLILLDFDAAFP